MAKKNTTTVPVRFERGKWITSDGIVFNTQSKAQTHILKIQNEKETKEIEKVKPTKIEINGKVE